MMKSALNSFRYINQHEIGRQDRISTWRRFIQWQLRSSFGGEVTVPWIHGTKFVARKGLHGLTGNIYLGLHEFRDMLILLHFLREGDVFADVGANVGSYTILAAGVRKSNVIAFEPIKEALSFLKENVRLNHLAERVSVVPAGVGAEKGDALFVSDSDTTNRIATNGDSSIHQTTSIPIVTLDSALDNTDVAIMKIDVEGYEEAVMDGAQRILRNPSLKVIIIETVSERVAVMMKEAGFSKLDYDPTTRRLTEPESAAEHNYIYVRDRDFVQKRLTSAPKVNVFNLSF